ncbi:hypothetical protein LZ838_19050 [Pseudomonas sp. AA27]|uniref:hypothetical protein n=1 Tax=Pseudomonas sp. AA27 TaxID=2908652 RepID=UPI001F1D518E|nr:hypothetical protein [Pseudomonas sp. AA27]MCF1489445.1 hypothetical protein [Pseudomonas sp. AA27]
MEKIELIRALIKAGRSDDLLAFVEGESPYLTDASQGVPESPWLRRIWVLVVTHLRFVTRYGEVTKPLIADGQVLSPYPAEFQLWLAAGAPGIALEDLQAYVREHPLD